MAREAVASETPAAIATSFSVTALAMLSSSSRSALAALCMLALSRWTCVDRGGPSKLRENAFLRGNATLTWRTLAGPGSYAWVSARKPRPACRRSQAVDSGRGLQRVRVLVLGLLDQRPYRRGRRPLEHQVDPDDLAGLQRLVQVDSYVARYADGGRLARSQLDGLLELAGRSSDLHADQGVGLAALVDDRGEQRRSVLDRKSVVWGTWVLVLGGR